MIRAIIVDDEQLAIDILAQWLFEIGEVEVIASFTDSNKALAYLSENMVDVVFLDIQMPHVNGMELANMILDRNLQIDVVFVTAYQQYSIGAFELEATDYLLKPVSKNRLIKTVQRLKKKQVSFEEDHSKKVVCLEVFGDYRVLIKENDQKTPLTTVRFRIYKAAELLIYLYCQQKSAINKDKIVEDLFGEMPAQKAAKGLHTATFYLRKVLMEHGFEQVLESEQGHFILKTENIVCDMMTVTEAFANLKTVNSWNIGHLMKIAQLYKGSFLEGCDYQWAELQKNYLEKIFVAGMLKMLRYLSNSGDLDQCLALGERLLEIDPVNEQAYEVLIGVCMENGDKARANRYSRELESAFQSETD